MERSRETENEPSQTSIEKAIKVMRASKFGDMIGISEAFFFGAQKFWHS